MEKQITTVYTKTLNLSDYLLCSHDGINGFARESMLNKQEAYLYTPEEHAAVQQALSEHAAKKDNVYQAFEDLIIHALENDLHGRILDRANAALVHIKTSPPNPQP